MAISVQSYSLSSGLDWLNPASGLPYGNFMAVEHELMPLEAGMHGMGVVLVVREQPKGATLGVPVTLYGDPELRRAWGPAITIPGVVTAYEMVYGGDGFQGLEVYGGVLIFGDRLVGQPYGSYLLRLQSWFMGVAKGYADFRVDWNDDQRKYALREPGNAILPPWPNTSAPPPPPEPPPEPAPEPPPPVTGGVTPLDLALAIAQVEARLGARLDTLGASLSVVSTALAERLTAAEAQIAALEAAGPPPADSVPAESERLGVADTLRLIWGRMT